MYNELHLSEIKAKGWAKEYLKTQASGMTGNLGRLMEPFNGTYWDEDKKTLQEDKQRFLGGLNSLNDAWVPFEQTGYWIDGMVRTAHLIDDETLYETVKPKLYKPLENADEDGFIGPAFLKDGMVWAHSVYLRSLVAEYTATHNPDILEKLKKHYLRTPLKTVYQRHVDLRIITVRDICDIEVALWLYGETGETAFLTMAEESYLQFNKIYQNDKGVAPHAKMRQLTVKGMIENDTVCNNHGVTYCEVCKLAAILHKYTGKEIYKKAAVNAFDKLYRDQMLIDGVNSSTEYLNGNQNSRSSHELCDVSDFTWAVGYLYMITGESKYGDWVENCIFNGGFGSVDDEFKSHQYFSCPNQVLADDHSNHSDFYKGLPWMSYAPKEVMACCTGNANRFFPNYVYRSWMKNEGTMSVFTYVPCEVSTTINGVKVGVLEETSYPFEDTVRLTISTEKSVKFILRLRVPSWSRKTTVRINGKEENQHLMNSECVIERTFKDGDKIEISFTPEIELIENAGGVSVKRGALLYALPIQERMVIEDEPRGIGDPEYPHYSLYGESQWNYGLDKNAKGNFIGGAIGKKPWIRKDNPMRIKFAAKEIENWKIRKVEQLRRKLHPRKRGKLVECKCSLTPLIPKELIIGKEELIELVPYCTTRLRIAIFPMISKVPLEN